MRASAKTHAAPRPAAPSAPRVLTHPKRNVPKVPEQPVTTPITPRPKALSSGLQAPLTPGLLNARAAGFERENADGAAGGAAPPKPPPLKQQIEQYFGDESLKTDRHMRELIETSPGGWVDVDEILGLKSVKTLRAKRDDVIQALRSSWLESWQDPRSGEAAVRRPPSKPLPKLLAVKPQVPAEKKVKPSSTPAAKAGVVASRPAVAPGAGGKMLFPGRLKGKVSGYDEESGSANISCPQIAALFQQEVLIDWREIERAGAAVDIGSDVSFMVEMGPDGTPQATEIQLEAPEDDEEGDQPAQPAKKRKTASAVVKETKQEAGAVLPSERHVGIVKSFHEGIGIGFIDCKATRATFGRDVSVEADELAGFSVGDTVSFQLTVDPELGTPRATVLEAE